MRPRDRDAGDDDRARVASILRETHERVRADYGAAIGLRREGLVTPALVLDLPATRRNITKMAEQVARLSADIRPHIKVHKSPELASLQVDAGAIGLSVATVWEAVVLVHSGLDHILIANIVVGVDRIRTVAELARRADILVAVDEKENIEDLSDAATLAGTEIGILVEIDTGMDRCGADSALEALELARFVDAQPGLSFRGLTGYEGHCSRTVDRDQRLKMERTAMRFLVDAADDIERTGLACPIRSAGGTATWDWTAAYPGVTEIQAGTYAVMDNYHGRMVGGFEHSLTVQSTVISRRPDRVILDVGSKSMGAGELTSIVGHDLPVLRLDEEHAVFDATGGSSLRMGDTVPLVPGYSPSTVNWFDAYHVVEDDTVIDIWPIVPRGPGHHGLLRQVHAHADR